MDTFSALADPTRRNIVELLAKNGELSATDIYDKFSASPPAISQHLKVLREANLVQVEKKAQQRIYHVNPAAMHKIEEWAKKMAQVWDARFSRLDKVLEVEKTRLRNTSARQGK